jgi:hypothetical protein
MVLPAALDVNLTMNDWSLRTATRGYAQSLEGAHGSIGKRFLIVGAK